MGIEQAVLSPETRAQIKANLTKEGVGDYLVNGKVISIVVPNYDIGRGLVLGKKSLLKEIVDEEISRYGSKKLGGKKCNLLVADFTKFRPSSEVLEEIMKKIPKIKKREIATAGTHTLNSFYKGKIIVFLGVDSIPYDDYLYDINFISKHSTAVFIHKEIQPGHNLNKHVHGAMGENGQLTITIK